MKIEILGMGCPKCLKLEENAKKALAGDGVTGEVVRLRIWTRLCPMA